MIKLLKIQDTTPKDWEDVQQQTNIERVVFVSYMFMGWIWWSEWDRDECLLLATAHNSALTTFEDSLQLENEHPEEWETIEKHLGVKVMEYVEKQEEEKNNQ